MNKSILALITLMAIPVVINNGFVRANSSRDTLNCLSSNNVSKCFDEMEAYEKTEWQNIKKTYINMLDACSRQDIDQCFAAYAPDFQLRQANKQVIDLQQFRQINQNFWQYTSQYRKTASVIGRDVGREYAKLTGIEYVNATVPGANNSRVPIRIENTFEQTWRRTSNGWKLVHYKTLEQETSVLGQKQPQFTPQQTAELTELLKQHGQVGLLNYQMNNQTNILNNFHQQMPRYWNP
jgi:hypothetical protein